MKQPLTSSPAEGKNGVSVRTWRAGVPSPLRGETSLSDSAICLGSTLDSIRLRSLRFFSNCEYSTGKQTTTQVAARENCGLRQTVVPHPAYRREDCTNDPGKPHLRFIGS